MEGKRFGLFCFFRVLLPLTFLAVAVVRYNVVSAVYLAVYLLFTLTLAVITPCISCSRAICVKRLSYLLTAFLSALSALVHCVFLYIIPCIEHCYRPTFLQNCTRKAMIVHLIGFYWSDGMSVFQQASLILPDLAVLVVSIGVLTVPRQRLDDLWKDGTGSSIKHEVATGVKSFISSFRPSVAKPTNVSCFRDFLAELMLKASEKIVDKFGDVFVGLMLVASVVLVPSLLSIIYFLVPPVRAIMWMCCKFQGKCFLLPLLMLCTAAHILTLYVYQFQFFQDVVPDDVARLLGLTAVIKTDCDQPVVLTFHSGIRWMPFVKIVILFLLYLGLDLKTEDSKPLLDNEQNPTYGSTEMPFGRYPDGANSNTEEETSGIHPSGSRTEDGAASNNPEAETSRKHPSGSSTEDGAASNNPEAETSGIHPSGSRTEDGAASNIPEAETPRRNGDPRSTGDSSTGADTKNALLFFANVSLFIVVTILSFICDSWPNFFPLLGVCLLWFLPQSPGVCKFTTFVLTIVVALLLLAEYIGYLDAELLLMDSMLIKEISLVRTNVTHKDLASQIFFTVFIVMILLRIPKRLHQDSPGQDSSAEGEDEIRKKIKEYYKSWTTFMWNFAGVHVSKLVIITVVFASVQEDQISAVNAVCLFPVAFHFVIYKGEYTGKVFRWVVFSTFVLILLKMVYHVSFFPVIEEHLCDKLNSSVQNMTYPPRSTSNLAWGLGLQKTDVLEQDFDDRIRPYILVLVVALFQFIVCRHQQQRRQHQRRQQQRRQQQGEEQQQEGIVFDDISREDADKDFVSCLKYFVNSTFYKFGLEICCVATAVTVCMHTDGFVLPHAIVLFVMVVTSGCHLSLRCRGCPPCCRGCLSCSWGFLVWMFAILLLLEYGICLGVPPFACVVSTMHNTTHFPSLVEYSPVLSHLIYVPSSNILLADFIQLLLMTLQWKVFEVKATEDRVRRGGNNRYIDEQDRLASINSVKDFTIKATTILDLWKQAVFRHMSWVTLIVVLTIWASQVNIFVAVLLAVIILYSIFRLGVLKKKPLEQLHKRWNWLIIIVVCFIIFKAIMRVVGCILMEIPFQTQLFYKVVKYLCRIGNEGPFQDAVGIAFLLLQRRIYSSYYYLHVADLLEAEHNLSSEFAKLIKDSEKNDMEKWEKEKERIQANKNQKVAFLKTRRAELREKNKIEEPTEHDQALRAGDYYLFEEDEDVTPKKEYATGPASTDQRVGPLQATELETPTSVDTNAAESQGNTDTAKKDETWGKCFVDWLTQKSHHISYIHFDVALKEKEMLRSKKEKIRRNRERQRAGTNEMEDAAQNGATSDDTNRSAHQEEQSDQSQSRKFRLLEAIFRILISSSELLCYFLMILNNTMYSSLLSLPLAVMMFLWGMLSVPRPSKTFWKVVFGYTVFVTGIRNVINMVIPFIPVCTGVPCSLIRRLDTLAHVDFALLVALLIHMSILKRYCLWEDDKQGKPENESGRSTPLSNRDEAETMFTEHPPGNVRDPVDEPGGNDEPKPDRVQMSSIYDATVVYVLMFCCDFIIFFVVIIDFWEFGPVHEPVTGYLASHLRENQIPSAFLVLTLILFVFITFDRIIFLKKKIKWKLCFHFVLVAIVHIYVFLVLPAFNRTSKGIQVVYFVKCLYFALSAYQIRCGYHDFNISDNYSFKSILFVKGFHLIPFLRELHVLVDWVFTGTTLSINNWMQMEDIYTNIFILKCWRRLETDHNTFPFSRPRARAKQKNCFCKILGFVLFLLIIFFILSPLLFFTVTASHSKPPTMVSFVLQMGAYQPIFKTTIQQNIAQITDREKEALMEHFKSDQKAVSFLNNFPLEDISVITFDGVSMSIWGISKPSQEELIQALNTSSTDSQVDPHNLKFSVTVHRSSNSTVSDTDSVYYLAAFDETEIPKLIEVIRGTRNDSVQVKGVFPRFLHISAKRIKEAEPLISGRNGFGRNNLTVGLSGQTGIGSLDQYWYIEEQIYGGSHFVLDKTQPSNFTREFQIITFNERQASVLLSFFTTYGVMGLYVSFILVAWRVIRGLTTGAFLEIIFSRPPNVDKVLQLCQDIYLVREMKEFSLEEDLFAKLIFLCRSPETLIKWTHDKRKAD